jgi:hypothetical protein
MVHFLIISLLMLLTACSKSERPQATTSPPPPNKQWYQGGTLHNTTIAEWKVATQENRLATSADMIAATLKNEGKQLSSINELFPLASALERCVSEAGDSEQANSQKVAGLAAGCSILMK